MVNTYTYILYSLTLTSLQLILGNRFFHIHLSFYLFLQSPINLTFFFFKKKVLVQVLSCHSGKKTNLKENVSMP